MKITILGSGTCVPSLKRYPCAVLVQHKLHNILIDAGPGIIHQLLKFGVYINDIDMILLSHFHLDHCADIAPFLFATKYSGVDREKKLTLAGGKGIRQLLKNLNKIYNHTIEMPEKVFEIIELDDEGGLEISKAKLRLEFARMKHTRESRGFRLIDGNGFVLVYSGDTDYTETLVALARKADVLICESSLPDEEKVSGHLTPSLAGRIAQKANVKKIVLTHFYPECDHVDMKARCQKIFKGKIVLAQDLMRL